MNPRTFRQSVLSNVENLLTRSPSKLDETDIILIGQLARMANGDDEENEGFEDKIERALSNVTATFASAECGSAPSLEAVRDWLVEPKLSFTSAIDSLDKWSAYAAGVITLGNQNRTAEFEEEAECLDAEIAFVGRAYSEDLVDAALDATRRIVQGGCFLPVDQPLVTLSAIIDERVKAALSGELFESPRLVTHSSTDLDVATQLCAALSKALAAPLVPFETTFDVHPAFFAQTSFATDLVLHGDAAENLTHLVFDIAPGITAEFVSGSVVVRFDVAPAKSPALVPIVGGHTGDVLRPQGGAEPGQYVFELGSERDVEAYALVIEGLVVLIRQH